MVFSSPIFVFLFLPIVLTGHLLLPARCRNTFLLLASIVFYAWGEQEYTLIMFVSIGLNYAMGLWIDRWRERDVISDVVAVAVIANLALLGFYKYANFIVDSFNSLLLALGQNPIGFEPVHLPLGISFFTFQALTYPLDVYRRHARVQKNPVDVALYVTLFPQLVAGPIVRYQEVADQIASRSVSLERYSYGIRRFVIGLAKKMLIANTMAVPADKVFALAPDDLTAGLAWLGIAAYTMQIYFDFSGYSDMAIGMGHMLGFTFPENFNYPYVSRSVKEFWRRWHMTLSRWFRDYLYIPMGGSQGPPWRTYLNLLTVFFLCGLWHGASWNFVVWGMMHGVFLMAERLGLDRLLSRAWRPVQHTYTMTVVIVGWVFFRAETLADAWAFLGAMIGSGAVGSSTQTVGMYWNHEVASILAVSLVAMTPALPNLAEWFRQATADRLKLRRAGGGAFELGGLALLFFGCAMALAAGTHNPFIYFRF